MECSVDQFITNKQSYTVIDVRSPIEFEDGHIPAAINVPLFTNEERAQVGTTYKKEGKEQAQWLGINIVAPKIPQLLKAIKEEIEEGKTPLITCYRGGLRSGSVYQFCHMGGLKVSRLIGGYKEYRNYIVDAVDEFIPSNAFVLHGLTGTGKTNILHSLKEQGFPVLNLEEIAGHRGSLFGHIGQTVQTQKMFDARLFDALDSIQSFDYLIMEAESKRIGRSIQPPSLLNLKENGVHIVVTSTFQKRVERILEDYILPFENQEWFNETFENILAVLWKRMRGNPYWKDINEAWKNKNYDCFISLLLEHYYDPMYLHKFKDYHASERFYSVCSDDINKAVKEIQIIVSKSHDKKHLFS